MFATFVNRRLLRHTDPAYAASLLSIACRRRSLLHDRFSCACIMLSVDSELLCYSNDFYLLACIIPSAQKGDPGVGGVGGPVPVDSMTRRGIPSGHDPF